jgi:predicted HTH transcriptional regulator
MTLEPEHVRTRIRLGEDARWEFKEVVFRGNRLAGPSSDALADEMAAFANARGGALLLGVTDAGEVQEVTRPQLDELERVVVDLCRNKIKPPIDADVRRCPVEPGRPILSVEIEPGYALHDSPGGAYRRIGSSKIRMSSDERLRLAQSRSQARFLWFDKQAVPGTGLVTLDEALWKPLLDAEGRLDPRRGLTKLALLTSEADEAAEATVAGVLLCSRAPEQWLPNACITATHYRGTDRASEQLDGQVITGPLRQQVANAVRFVERNMRVGAHKSPARMDLPEYSLEAVFEAVVNAVVHRDYAISGSRIRLSMFADRLEIDVPGSLPNNLTTEDMSARQSTRNEAIVSVLARLPVEEIPGSRNRAFFMERRGSGVPIIMRETRALTGKSPDYRLLGDSGLFLTLPAAPTTAHPQTVRIAVRGGDGALTGAQVVVMYPNGIRAVGTTGEDGVVVLDLHSTELPVLVLAAAAGHVSYTELWDASSGFLSVALAPLPRGGSLILPDGSGPLPALRGSLRVREDDAGRATVTGDLVIQDGAPQPVHFTRGEDLHIRDKEGNRLLVRVAGFFNPAAVLEYRAPPEPRREGVPSRTGGGT